MQRRELKQIIHTRGWELAQAILGEPQTTRKTEAVYRVPWRRDENPSLSVLMSADGERPAGTFVDQASGVGGDVLELISRVNGIDIKNSDGFKKVLEIASRKLGISVNGSASPAKSKQKEEFTLEQIESQSDFVEHDAYRNAITGAIEWLVVRFHPEGQRKRFYPYSATKNGLFRLGGRPSPTPLFQQPEISEAPRVVIVEGEKCARFLQFLGIPATTWMGGAQSVKSADFSPLSGKEAIYLWPDYDEHGEAAMRYILDEAIPALDIQPKELYYLDPGKHLQWLEKGGDCADVLRGFKEEGLKKSEIRGRIRDILSWSEKVESAEEKYRNSGHVELVAYIDSFAKGEKAQTRFPYFPELSSLTNELFPGSNIMLCGGAGVAKSILCIQWMLDMIEAGINVKCMMLESSRSFHLSRMMDLHMRKPSHSEDEFTFPIGNFKSPKWVSQNPERAMKGVRDVKDIISKISKSLFAGRDVYKEPPMPIQLVDWSRRMSNEGARLKIIDSLSVANMDKCYKTHQEYIYKMLDIDEEFGSTTITVMHPRNPQENPHLYNIRGGQDLPNQSYSVFWVQGLEPEPYEVMSSGIKTKLECNAELMILKNRVGPGRGKSIGLFVNPTTLRTVERGILSKEKKKR